MTGPTTLTSAVARVARDRSMGPLRLILAWHARWKSRRSLHRLPDHLLRDIGLTPDDVAREVVKPFWRP